MRRVNIHYRYFHRNTSEQNSAPLAKLICDALSNTIGNDYVRDFSKHRAMEIDDAVMLLNRCDETEEWVFGELAFFKPGEGIKLIENIKEQKILNFDELTTPDGKHLIRGVTYWLAKQNHLILIQAPNVSISGVRKYFNWLLYEKYKILSEEFVLGAQINVDDEWAPEITQIQVKPKGWKFNDIKEKFTNPSPSKDGFKQAGSQTVEKKDTVFEVLKAIGLGKSEIEVLKNKAGPDGELQLDLSIKIKTNNNKIIPLTRLDANTLFSETEDDEIVLRGKHGKQQGKLVILTYPHARVKEVNSFLDPDDALRALIEAFNFFVSNHYIEGEI